MPVRLTTVFLLTLTLAGLAPPAPALAPRHGPECPCTALLEMTMRRVEETYVGYHLEIDDANRAAYDTRKQAAREAAARSDADCFLVLRDWMDGFGDPHLFLLESPRFSDRQLDSLRRTAVHTDWTEASLRRAFESRAGDLDPVEGLWYGRDGRYGIVRAGRGRSAGNDATRDASEFVVVSLETADEGWRAGEEKARLRRRPDGEFDATVRMADHSTRRMVGRLARGNFFRLPGGVGWAKEAPVPPGSRAMDPDDPMNPTVEMLEADVALVSVPSHDPGLRARLDSLVRAHHEQLLAARLMIVDIRGNGGGSSLTTAPLMPYVHATPERDVPGPQGDPVVLASADNLAYFSRWKQGEDTPGWLLDLLARMGRNYGEVVPFQDPPDTTRGWVPDTTFAGPSQVAVLIDGGVGSAAEAFLLFALHSPRVTVFGEPTWGMIDYQNVGIVRVGCPDSGLLLGYPTIAASASLPEGGLNATGILPHVAMDAGPGMIARVLDHYAGKEADDAVEVDG